MGKADKRHTNRRQPVSRRKATTLGFTDLPLGSPLVWALSRRENASVLLDPWAAIERRLQSLCIDLERRNYYLTWRPTQTADREVLEPARCPDLKLPSPGKAPNLPGPGLSTLILDGQELHDVLIHPAPTVSRQQEQPRHARTKLETEVETWLAELEAEGKQRPSERDCRTWAGKHGYPQNAVW